MQVTAGMGESGETYVVGEDLLMRSDSRFSEESTTLKTTVDTETVRLALRGETGLQETPDYRGIPVLSAYGPLRFEAANWTVMAEIDTAEVLVPIQRVWRAALGSALFAAAGATMLGLALARLLARRGRSDL
jgi:methyl-accepting chemotaxis protein